MGNCFRCVEKGSTSDNRLKTTTYVPSFKIEDAGRLAKAKEIAGNKYERLISPQGFVQIYVATLNDLMPYFMDAARKGLTYQPAMEKTTMATMEDSRDFKKRKANNQKDNGEYAASQAKYKQMPGCPEACFKCDAVESALTHSLLKGSKGTCVHHCNANTCSETPGGTDCTMCQNYFTNQPSWASSQPIVIETQASAYFKDEIEEFEELAPVEEILGSAVQPDPSGMCMTESYIDERGEEVDGVAIEGMCVDDACDNDDPEHLCKCSDLENELDELLDCPVGAASALQPAAVALAVAVSALFL